MKKIYVASSWRNLLQQGVVLALRAAGHEVYDFKNPPSGSGGFSWRNISDGWERWTQEQFRSSLAGPEAEAGFGSDWEAMQWADCCVLVMPSGRSAHLEAGWFVGAGKPLYILLSEDSEPELMYKMANGIFLNMGELLNVVGCAN